MAGKCGYDLRGQEMLLDALSAMGLPTKQGKAYRNTEESRSLLSKDSEQHLGYIIAHHFHILYSMGPQMCREVIRKAVGTLVRGRILYIHDFLLNENRDSPLFPALFSLNMLVNTKEGRAYSEVETRTMMKDAGLSEVKRVSFESLNSSGIL